MDALKVPVAEVFENWGKEIQPIVGKGNYSMEPSEIVSQVETKHLQRYMRSMMHPTKRW